MKPAEQFEQGVLNTQLPSQLSQTATINRLVPPQAQNPSDTTTYLQAMQEPQLPTTIGSLLSSAGQTFNNALNNYVEQPINKYLINPAERWYYNNYLLPQTKAIDDAYAQTIKAKNAQIQRFQHSQLNQSATSNSSLLSEASGY
ncbi:MAG: hypothetical protein QW393_05005, partial [Candidatus Micrarchaeaceae archaeon]